MLEIFWYFHKKHCIHTLPSAADISVRTHCIGMVEDALESPHAKLHFTRKRISIIPVETSERALMKISKLFGIFWV